MTPAAKLYAKLFVGFSILFGTFSGIPAIIMGFALGQREKLFVVVVTVLVVLATAAIVAFCVAAIKIYDIQRLGHPVTDASLSVRQEKAVVLPCNHAEALERCIAAVRALPRAAVIDGTTFADGIIHARTAMALANTGQNIQFRVRPRSAGSTIVTVSSRPRNVLLFLDQGRNLKMVERIVHLLQEPATIPSPQSGR